MNKKTLGNLLKYALAAAVLGYVVYSNWGDPRGTAGKVVVGQTDGEVTGLVVAYTPDQSITLAPYHTLMGHPIETPSGETTTLALKH
ncbi:MAG TPA: hypothetical protein VFW33_04550, partial [Gemmataceae bacterium]|nr:hypothetical protein [Gemmataceae bacterium]